MELEEIIRQKLMISFNGMQAPEKLLEDLRRRPLGGVTLFRAMNYQGLAQMRALTGSLQAAARSGGRLPLLIGVDQEGGQLMELGDGTPFPGNMALGAAGDENLAHRVGRAIGLELAAVGVNVDYAPAIDVASNPDNPGIGVRSFGQDPARVARLGAAMVAGMQSAGIAATAKHFPGYGDIVVDSHYSTPVVPHSLERLREVEMPPFRAAVEAGVWMVMTAHLALPALNDGADMPATLSRPVLTGLLRKELEFQGVIITDAMNMGAIAQGQALLVDCIASLAAGADLLLLVSDEAETEALYQGLLHAARRRLLNPREMADSAGRVLALKRWLAGVEQPPLAVVGGDMHQKLALEVARRATTVVRNTAGLLPLRLKPSDRVAVVFPRPEDLTPADTSSYVAPQMAAALRKRHPNVDEFILPLNPSAEETAAFREQARSYDLVVAGTISAPFYPGQAALVQSLLDSGAPTVAVALRTPYDLKAYPAAQTYVCTY
ncbi:MAG TPA: glycoside hydrolase family 3 N-terminal domain-containing protein, partial [Longimicrobiales bacterium]